MKKLKQIRIRLSSIYHILTDRNFILITDIKEFTKEGEPCRSVTVYRRTDYFGESDYLSCVAGGIMCEPENLKDNKNN